MAQSVSRPANRYLYEEIRDQIRGRIEQGRYAEGDRLPSTRDFVEEFSTTPVTINKALGDLVETGHIHRVPKSGSFVNSRSDWETGRRQRTGIVGIVAFDTNVSIYWTKVVEAMQDALEERGYHAIIGYSDHSYEKALSYVDDLVEKGIDGLIFVPIDDQSREDYQSRNEAVCERIEEYGIPFVLFDRRLSNMRFSSVTADVYRAARELTEALAQAGSRRPACLTLDYAEALWKREEAFRDHAPRLGMELAPDAIRRFRGSRIRPEDAEQLAQLLTRGGDFDGLFIANSGLYNGFLRAEALLGHRFDVPIVTFRDIETSEPTRPVARALQPVHRFGYAAGELLARMIDSEVPGIDHGSALHVVLPIDIEYPTH